MGILNFDTDSIIGLHFFTENLNFPIAIATYSAWEEQQVNYLKHSVHLMTSKDICLWCKHHRISCQIIYPISRKQIFKHPFKYVMYLKLKKQFKML